jgi:hypothetical protein
MTNKMTTTGCGNCGGSGRYYFGDRSSGACFPCNGTGKVRISFAKLEAMRAETARWETYRAEAQSREEAEALAYSRAEDMILDHGIEGARRFFAQHRTDPVALAGLIYAMRDHGFSDASNAVVRHRSTLAGAL